MSTTVDILCLLEYLYNQLVKIKYAVNLRHKYMLGIKFHKNTNFQSLEVLDRGSETQLQVAENLNFLAQCSKD